MAFHEMIRRVAARHSLLRRMADAIYPGDGRNQFVRWFKRQFPLTRRKYRDSVYYEILTDKHFRDGLRNGLRKYWPLTRQKYLDEEAWWSLKDTLSRVSGGAEAVLRMEKPTISELKRVLADKDQSELRAGLFKVGKRCRFSISPASISYPHFVARLKALRAYGAHARVPDWDAAKDTLAWWVWIAELAEEAEVQAQWDAAHQNPTPGAPGIWGRL